ncbi:MAG: response regulator [Desulfatibacillum sp.]|nr:response regulator [Desulfatibacillum sp.]
MDSKLKILLVEDNPADVDLTRENLESSKILHELYTVPDGVEAMAFLKREGPYADVPKPHLVLLDLNLPKKDGREVLVEMKADPDLRRIPVVVLTSSQAEEDVVKSYDLQASAFVTKPVNLEGFGKIVRGIKCFWFSVVRYSPE